MWHSGLELPEQFQLQNVGTSSWEQFVEQSDLIVPEVKAALESVLGELDGSHNVLDFGCGIGRIAMKLWMEECLPTHGCDINPAAIDYLNRQLQGPELMVSQYEPPLDYDDNFFDAVFSISIWTHLPPELQVPWLKEIHRILKPGGHALISIASVSLLPFRKERVPVWEKYTEADVKEAGVLFTEYRFLKQTPEAYPGVTASYGAAMHDFDHVRETWGEVFASVEIKPKAIHNAQDLVLLKKHEAEEQ